MQPCSKSPWPFQVRNTPLLWQTNACSCLSPCRRCASGRDSGRLVLGRTAVLSALLVAATLGRRINSSGTCDNYCSPSPCVALPLSAQDLRANPAVFERRSIPCSGQRDARWTAGAERCRRRTSRWRCPCPLLGRAAHGIRARPTWRSRRCARNSAGLVVQYLGGGRACPPTSARSRHDRGACAAYGAQAHTGRACGKGRRSSGRRRAGTAPALLHGQGRRRGDWLCVRSATGRSWRCMAAASRTGHVWRHGAGCGANASPSRSGSSHEHAAESAVQSGRDADAARAARAGAATVRILPAGARTSSRAAAGGRPYLDTQWCRMAWLNRQECDLL